MRINKLFIGVATVATGLALGSLQASAQTVMKFSSWLSPKHAVNAVVYPTWIAAIEKATNGRVTGKIEYNLAPPPGQIDLIEDGTEHSLTLHVWSRADSAQEVHEIIDTLKTLLHDQPLTLQDHDLVNLRHEFTEARIDPDGETMHGIVRYRAVTEPLQQVAA